ncbi:Y-family DNA polymerase [Siculibacillus lacustris]|uniref:Y-family DNA polymerase n=1 Tax=Siculibacillus lacustris TaxID=1549641 RepID=UPI001D196277|nr:DNA polymerase Y family protein [Siculibacillus lacustris]
MALQLPRLPTDRLHRRAAGASWLSTAARRTTGADTTASDAAAPLAVFARVGAAYRLEAVDAAAAARGLAVGQPLAEARARVPDLRVVERDRTGEAETLEAIADWCDRFTPLVGLDRDFPDAGLVLDVTGVAHLFGGEAGLAARMVEGLAAQGFGATVAVAGSVGAARAVARHGLAGAPWRVVAAGEDGAALAPLPVAAIDPAGSRVADLARLGLGSIDALLALPRAALARRFGRDLLDRLDEAMGALDRPISPRRPVAMLAAERRFVEPIVARDDVAAVLHSLACGLAESLERRGEGLRIAELALWRVDGTVRRLRIGTGRPIRDPDLLLSLFAERLKGEAEEIDTGFGIDLIRLSVPLAVRDDPAQIDLAGDTESKVAFDLLLDRLGARLGSRRITASRPADAHRPEAASVPVIAASPEGRAAARAWSLVGRPAADEPPIRPIRLLARPERIDTVAELPDGPPLRFRWRRALYRVERAEGPERIAAEWWRLPLGLGPEGGAPVDDEVPDDGLGGAPVARLSTAAATRDYFRVEDPDGRRFWIFRSGLFSRETNRPLWFLHGIFA